MQEESIHAIKVLKNGGIVIFPTDTAFGIGCRMDDEKAVARLFKIRRRPETKATPVLVSDLEMAKEYWENVPDLVVQKLVKPYWPGALTIVLPCKAEKVPGLVRGGGNTLGLRMPDSEGLLNIIEEVGVPIIGTSANFAGDPTPYRFEDLNPELVGHVDYVFNPESVILNEMKNLNNLPNGSQRSFDSAQDDNNQQASTVIDCSVNPWKILRQGVIKIDSLF